MERRGLYDDRAYWKQAMALHNCGYEIHYLVISHTEKSDKGTTNEGIHYQIFEGKKYIKSVVGNYLVKKILPIPTEFDEMFANLLNIQPDIIQIVDLRVLRILNQIKHKLPSAKIIYDIREPRDQNLLDLRMKDWKVPMILKRKYAIYIQAWEYQKAEKCDYLLGVDDGIAKRIQTNLPGKSYTTIYNFTNLAKKRNFIPLDKRLYDAAYVGGLSEIRGAKTILLATEIIVKKHPDFKLILLGKSHCPKLSHYIEDFIQSHHLDKNITWLKGIPYQEVSDYYNQIKLGLNPLKDVPAHREIIQIKLFEYMNYGIPIVSSDFGAMQEYVEENNVGVCIKCDPTNLATNIIELLQNKESMHYYSENGYKAVDQKFNWHLMEKKYLDIIHQLLNQ